MHHQNLSANLQVECPIAILTYYSYQTPVLCSAFAADKQLSRKCDTPPDDGMMTFGWRSPINANVNTAAGRRYRMATTMLSNPRHRSGLPKVRAQATALTRQRFSGPLPLSQWPVLRTASQLIFGVEGFRCHGLAHSSPGTLPNPSSAASGS